MFIEKLHRSIQQVGEVTNLVASAAQVYGRNVVGVILTGMGQDGLVGMHAIKETGWGDPGRR